MGSKLDRIEGCAINMLSYTYFFGIEVAEFGIKCLALRFLRYFCLISLA